MTLSEQWHWQTGRAWYGIGIYHVTLTIPSREPLFGELVIPENNPAKAYVQRTELGEIVTEEALRINHYYPDIRVIQHCLMPDHLHVIYYVTKPLTKSIKSVIRGLWQGVKKIGRDYTANRETPFIHPEFNSGRTDGDNLYPFPIFTERPFIRPLSRRGQLKTMIHYVRMNPQRLATKRLMPNLFWVQDNIEIAGRTYKGVGYADLLQRAHYMPVHVRSIWVENAEKQVRNCDGSAFLMRNMMT